MDTTFTLKGISPVVMHSAQRAFDTTSSWAKEKAEIIRKKDSNRTPADTERLREIETDFSIYWDENGLPTWPAMNIRAAIETAARKLRQGPLVREGVIVKPDSIVFTWPEEQGTTRDEICKLAQFTVNVRVMKRLTERTRAKFNTPWTLTFTVDHDESIASAGQVHEWLDICGRRVGFGDWRPEKSGAYGTFEVIKR